MCFSAEASFTGAVVISSIGVATARKVKKPTQYAFASIPFLLGIQQFAEGFLWLSIPYPEQITVQQYSTYIFLIVAKVIWPIVIPLSVYLLEDSEKRKKILQLLLFLGISASLYYAFDLISSPVKPFILDCHIRYTVGFPSTIGLIALVLYLIAAIPPLFISSNKRVHLLGALMLLSFIATIIFFVQHLTSVWCFFAALISVVILWILKEPKKII